MEALRSLTGTVRNVLFSKTWTEDQRYNRLSNTSAIAEKRLGVARHGQENQTHGEKAGRCEG